MALLSPAYLALLIFTLSIPERLYLLRDPRSIHLTFDIRENLFYAPQRHRAHLQHFVEVLEQYIEDSIQSFLLSRLGFHIRYRDPPFSQAKFERQVMTVECFAGVTSIARVGFDRVPALFAQCLEMRVKGEGGNLASLEWPTQIITVKWGSEIKEVSECQSWQPGFDW